MAISRIQQSQISGSLSYDDSLEVGSGLLAKTKLSDDLNALRSLIKDIKGSGNWYTSATQDLSDIYGAMRADGSNADFQGEISSAGLASVGGALFVGGAAGLSGSLAVAGNVNLNGNVVLGDASSDLITFTAKAGSALDMNSYKVSSLAQATTLGDALAYGKDASVSDLIVSSGDFTVDSSGNVAAAGTLGVTGAATFGGGITVNSAIADFNAGITANSIKIDGDAATVGRLYVVGSDGSIADSSSMWYDASGSSLYVSGAIAASGAMSASSAAFVGNVSAASASISGPLSAGSATVSAALGVGGALTVTGATALNGGLTMDTNKFTVADGTGNVMTQGTLGVAGAASFSSTVGITGAATLSSTLSVTGGASLQSTLGVLGAASFNSTVGILGAATVNSLSVTGSSGLSVSNGSVFNGLVDVNAGMSASLIKIDGDVAQRLYIVDSDGSIKDESKLVFDGSDLSITGGLRVSGNAAIDGDLLVKGAFTYIETSNMKVKDAFIYLATGSAGTTDSGIVLSKGAGSSWDLIVGQDGGAGELIFSKVATNASGDSPADLGGSALVPAWMSQAKIGSAQGTMVGSISKSGSDFLVATDGAAELKLQSAGNAAISFASASQVPDASFSASTIVGMLNELRLDVDGASAGGNLKKQAYAGTAVAAGVLDFSALGSLSSAAHKLVDVFVNGVLMAPSYDLTGISTTSVTFSGSYSFTSDDVITVVIRG